jgi:aspartate/methionine/tyrosine aminotransferase
MSMKGTPMSPTKGSPGAKNGVPQTKKRKALVKLAIFQICAKKELSKAEMQAIAERVAAFASEDLVVIADEVYKYIVQDGEHVHFASLPGMASRTLTVSSAGKTFGATGWQVGWVVGAAPLIAEVQALLPFLQFCASTPMQAALVTAITEAEQPFEGEENYYAWLTAEYRRKRAKLRQILEDAGLAPFQGGGGVFLLADVSAHVERIPTEFRDGYADDWAFCRWLAIEYGVLSIPTSSFYASADSVTRPLVRFAFCKSDETLEAARRKFARFAQEAELRGVVKPVRGKVSNPSLASS